MVQAQISGCSVISLGSLDFKSWGEGHCSRFFNGDLHKGS